MLRAILALFFLLTAAPAVRAAPLEPLLVGPAWLDAHLAEPGLVILQVGDKAGYEGGHIPGARLVSLADISRPGAETGGLMLQMPDPEALRGKLEALGVSDGSRIVVYPTREGIQSATRVMFTLDAAGLGARTHLLEGGAAAWTATGRSLTAQARPVVPGKLSKLKMRKMVVDAEFVKRRAGKAGYALIDARAPEFFSGARSGQTPVGPHKAGHIPGAKNVPFNAVTTVDLKLASPSAIAALFKAAGVKAGDTVIAYCHVGQQATAAILAARTLGLRTVLYDGAFEEWSRLNMPVGTAP